jgi:molybdopterin molybdotransferase
MGAGGQAEPLPALRHAAPRPFASARACRIQRGIVSAASDGTWQVELTGRRAGILRSLSEANALVVLGHEQGSVAAGDPVTVWLFDGLT